MRIEKLYLEGWVTVECLCDVIGGWKTIADCFESYMWRWADRNDFFITQHPTVNFCLPDYDSHWYFQKYIKVHVVACGVRVTPIEDKEIFRFMSSRAVCE